MCGLYADREYTGKVINLNNVSHSKIRALDIEGETKEIGEGDKSPDNPYELVESKPTVKIIGKNILNPDNKFISGYLNNFNADAESGSDQTMYRTFWINMPFKTGDKITISSNNDFYVVRFIDDNNNSYSANYTLPHTWTITDACDSIQISLRTGTADSEFTYESLSDCQIQAEYGVSATDFKPYDEQSVKYESYKDDCVLNSVGDVADTYAVITGEYVQRVGVKILTSEEDGVWRMPATNEENAVFALTCDSTVMYSGNLLCNILNTKAPVGGYAAALEKGMGLYYWKSNNIVYWYFVVPLTAAGSLSEWYTYLQGNAVTVYYELAEPVTTMIDKVTVSANIPDTTMYIEESNDLGSIRTVLQTKGQ